MREILKKHADKLRFLIVGSTNTVLDFGILFSLPQKSSLILYQHSSPFCSHFLQIKNILSSQHPKT